MRAIVLAAGRGKRMGPDGEPLPKCLQVVGGKTLLVRMIDALRDVEVVDEVIVVVGFRQDQIRAAVEAIPPNLRVPVRFLENERFEEGSILSLERATECFERDDLLVMDADVLFHTDVLTRLVESPHASAFLLDRRSEATGEEMMLVAREGRVRRIARNVAVEEGDVVGEGVGFLKLARTDQAPLADAVAALVAAGGTDRDYEDALDRFLAEAEVGYEEVSDLPWTEIDFPEDLARARDEILPAIEG